MERKAFDLLLNGEHTWWYQGRSIVVDRILHAFVKKQEHAAILDMGAGWGGMLHLLQPYGKVTALEPDAEARHACEARGYDSVLEGALPTISEESYDLVTLFDVLEHTPDDQAFLANVHHILRHNGQLLLTVPAYEWLWSTHDETHHHYRRYTRSALSELLKSSGFTVRYASYWNSTLFFPAALLRLFGISGESSFEMHPFLNKFFLTIVQIESAVIPSFSLPFGTSIVILAQRRS